MSKAKKETPPKKTSTDIPTSFRLDGDLMRKVKYISVVDSSYGSQTEIVQSLLSKFVADYEKKNGEIKLK